MNMRFQLLCPDAPRREVSELIAAVEALAEITGEEADEVMARLCGIIERQTALRRLKGQHEFR